MSAVPPDELLHRIGQTQPPLSGTESVPLGLAALTAVGFPATWLAVRHLQVMAHEGSRALVGSAMGMKILGVKLMPDATGVTGMRPGGSGGRFLAAPGRVPGASVGTQTAAAYEISWLLMLSGIRIVACHWTAAADAAALARLPRIGRPAWAWLWLAGTVAALAAGGSMLI